MDIVYIVENDETIISLFRKLLNRSGYVGRIEVRKVSIETVREIAANRPSFLFLNFDTSVVDFFELYAGILSTPFVCLTSNKELYMHTLQMGAFDCLFIPAERSSWELTLERCLLYMNRLKLEQKRLKRVKH